MSCYNQIVRCASHLTSVLQSPDHLREAMHSAEREIRNGLGDDLSQVSAIAVSGVSGLVLGTALALRLNKHILVVRKEQESRHSDNVVEGLHGFTDQATLNYVIVDDLMSSGYTVARMQVEIDRHTCGEAKFLGIYLYSDEVFSRKFSEAWAPIISTQKEKYIRSKMNPKVT